VPGFTMPDRRFLCDVYDVGCPAGIKESSHKEDLIPVDNVALS
jgi:hypothetical protein